MWFLENADRLLLPRYLLKIKIAGQDKFSKAPVSRYFSKYVFLKISHYSNHSKTPVLESPFNKTCRLELLNP